MRNAPTLPNAPRPARRRSDASRVVCPGAAWRSWPFALVLLGACTGSLGDAPSGPGQAGAGTGAAGFVPTSADGSDPSRGGADPAWEGPGADGSPFRCDPEAAVDPGPAPLQRLTPAQYAATAREIFGDGVDLSGVLPRATRAGHIGLAQADPSPVEVERYAAAAETLADHVAAEVERFAPCAGPDDGSTARDCARGFLETFGTRIYRSPLAPDDTDRLLNVFDVGYDSGGYAGGVRLVVRAMLEAPRFLYRFEWGDGGQATASAVPLTGYEMASRLSFAFWNQGPDAVALDKAESGVLDTPEGIDAEAARLMGDPRARQSFRAFFHTWFGLDHLDTVEKDREHFSVWNDDVPSQMRAQADAYFDEVLFGDEGTLQTLFSLDPADFAPAGLEDWSQIQGDVPGLLALPAVLSVHSKPDESFPIYRGLFVREQLLCQPLPPPPENVGEPPEPAPGVSGRERFEQHSSDPACRGCHRLIDPLGFAFENYDAVGRYRATDEGRAVDASGELVETDVDGHFEDLSELATKLSRSEVVQACVSRQWFRYVMQRFEQPADGCSMQRLAQSFADAGQRFQALRRAIVQTPAFRMRRPIEIEEEAP